jgi:hypothetical protein
MLADGFVRTSGLQVLDQLGHDLREGAPQGTLFLVVEDVEDKVPHVLDVYGRSPGGELVPGVCKEREREPAVYRVRHATDEAARLKAAHQMRQTRQLRARDNRQLAHPQGTVGLLGQARKDVVLEEAQVYLAPQLAAEDIGQGRDDAVERSPRLQLVGGEPCRVSRRRGFFS